jgi:hypothetical protein
MFANSVILRTAQAWKFIVAVVALLVGSFAPLWPSTGLDWTSGTVLAVAGYAYGCLAIRCPSCGMRWLWQATLRAELWGPLAKKADCPGCGRNFAAPGEA